MVVSEEPDVVELMLTLNIQVVKTTNVNVSVTDWNANVRIEIVAIVSENNVSIRNVYLAKTWIMNVLYFH